MSRSDDIWILGIHMTKYGKHHDHDVVDLEGAKVGPARVIGLGSACGIHILEKSALAVAG